MQIASLAPLVALMARGASAKEIAMMSTDIPPPTMNELWRRAQAAGCKPELEDNFKAAVNVLWQYFEAGAAEAGKPVPATNGDKNTLLMAAWDQPNKSNVPSGVLIATRMEKWEAKKHATDVCAYHCGFEASRAAQTLERAEIDKDCYALGFTGTESRMGPRVMRARAMFDDDDKDLEPMTLRFAAGC